MTKRTDAPLSRKDPDPKVSALAIALTQRPHYIPDTQLHEFFEFAPHSLWYSQAKTWATDPPPEVKDEKARLMWSMACKEIVRIVDMGFVAGAGWWPIETIYPLRVQHTAFYLLLADFTLMLRTYNEGTHPIRNVADAMRVFKKMDEGYPVVSTGFEVFADIMLGRGWEKRFGKFIAAAKQAAGRKEE